MSHVIGIRCREIGLREWQIFFGLKACGLFEGVYFVRDLTAVPAGQRGAGDPIVFAADLTAEFLDSHGLKRDFENFTWRCGDYAVYRLREKHDAQFYYLIEPDVSIAIPELDEIITTLINCDHDLIIPHLRAAKASWSWRSAIEYWGYSAFECNFGFVRLSKRLVDLLLETRRGLGHSAACTSENYPNDEAFVASVAMSSGMSCVSMQQVLPGRLKFFNVHVPLLDDKTHLFPVGAVLHPVLPHDAAHRKVRQAVDASLRGSRLESMASWLRNRDLEAYAEYLEKIITHETSLWFRRQLAMGSRSPNEKRDVEPRN